MAVCLCVRPVMDRQPVQGVSAGLLKKLGQTDTHLCAILD